MARKWYTTLNHSKMHPHTKYYKRYAPDTIILKTRSEVKVTVTLNGMCHSALQGALIHQIWNSYFNEYRRYAPDSMPILETRSEVKVTVTQGWYTELCHPKMLPHTKFGIHTSHKMRYALDTIILKTRSEVMVTMTHKWSVTPPSQDESTHHICDFYLK